MAMRAYYEGYLEQAQRILGDMMDFAVNTCEMDSDKFFTKFIISGVSEQFERGNPRYVAGMTGCEIVKEVMERSQTPCEDVPDAMYLDKSPEYWSGWALAYYQWYTAKSFERIHQAVSINEILNMYPTLHEADISKFVPIIDEKIKVFYPETNLKRMRTTAGLSQRKLAEFSGVPLRQIQMFEQRQRDINKTQAINVVKLARTLGCTVERLIEL